LFDEDNYMTVTEASKAIGKTKQETLELIEKYQIRKFKAFPNDTRFLVSMKDVNLILMRKSR